MAKLIKSKFRLAWVAILGLLGANSSLYAQDTGGAADNEEEAAKSAEGSLALELLLLQLQLLLLLPCR